MQSKPALVSGFSSNTQGLEQRIRAERRNSLLILVATFGIAALVCIGLITFGIRDLIRAKASVDWPTSPGKVLSSSVFQGRGDDGVTYQHVVLYEFNVNNTTYSGDRIAYGDGGTSDPSHAQEIVIRYPQDKNVTVYYMPNNPKECLLEVGVKGQAFIKPGIGLVCLIIVFVTFGILYHKLITPNF
jgi:hypothetical protein